MYSAYARSSEAWTQSYQFTLARIYTSVLGETFSFLTILRSYRGPIRTLTPYAFRSCSRNGEKGKKREQKKGKGEKKEERRGKYPLVFSFLHFFSPFPPLFSSFILFSSLFSPFLSPFSFIFFLYHPLLFSSLPFSSLIFLFFVLFFPLILPYSSFLFPYSPLFFSLSPPFFLSLFTGTN